MVNAKLGSIKTNSKVFWTTQELPYSSTEWETQITAINVAGVPEPASWALMLGGFGLVGRAMRSRRSKVAFA